MQTIITTNLTPQELRNEIATAVRQSLAGMKAIAPTPPPDPPMDTSQACSYLGIAHPTIYRKVADNTIPFHRHGKKLIFFESELRAWIKAKK